MPRHLRDSQAVMPNGAAMPDTVFYFDNAMTARQREAAELQERARVRTAEQREEDADRLALQVQLHNAAVTSRQASSAPRLLTPAYMQSMVQASTHSSMLLSLMAAHLR